MPFAVLHSEAEWAALFGQAGPPAEPAIVTIGNFDGVHLGHQRILRTVCELARQAGCKSAVLTFFPHPARVLRPAEAPPLLMTLDQRIAAIEALGVDIAFVLPFDLHLAAVSAEDFVRRFLVDTMHARALLVGGNFRFGHKQAGDVRLLVQLGQRWGFDVKTLPPVIKDGIVVSSTAIRGALREGRVEDARDLLGRAYALAGEIRTGTGQGRKLVVPTLNLATEQEMLPKNGVYATEVAVGGKTYRAATNVGMRPTFDGVRITIESHLFDFDETLTSGKMEVHFWTRLRDEQKFSGPDALRRQVLRDIDEARRYFAAAMPTRL
ncbi:MAG TPA: bifunctional riboflavin kinase/FAD synthetase [Candidatus Acidoferrales bacterium]|jgi:riboflavin kinase/FMN adenylyltransferase|nr:bifunctional riboflavin kinase/FAD synthetase [Candidatus Acidoferrales bacterium]